MLDNSLTVCLTQNAPSIGKILRWPSDTARDWVKDFVEKTKINPQVLAIVAFGSTIRDARYSADIDLLVVYSKQKPVLFNRPIDVDVRMVDHSEIEQKLNDNNELIGWVVRFGLVLCEQEYFWTDSKEKWLRKLRLPSAEVAEERAMRASKLREKLLEVGDVDAANEQGIAMLTQRARSYLIRHNIFPASRPELPMQLAEIGENIISSQLAALLQYREAEATL